MFQVLRHDVDRASGRTHGGIGAWEVLHWRQTHWDHHAHSRLSMLKPKGGARHPPRRRRRRRFPVSQPDPPCALRALHPGARCPQRAGKSDAPSYAHSAHAYVHTAPMCSPFFHAWPFLRICAHPSICWCTHLPPPNAHPPPPFLTPIRFSPVNEQAESAVVLVHPTCGPTQPGDIPGSVRFRTYEVLQDEIKASLLYMNPILSSSYSFPIYAHTPILPIGFLYIYMISPDSVCRTRRVGSAPAGPTSPTRCTWVKYLWIPFTHTRLVPLPYCISHFHSSRHDSYLYLFIF